MARHAIRLSNEGRSSRTAKLRFALDNIRWTAQHGVKAHEKGSHAMANGRGSAFLPSS